MKKTLALLLALAIALPASAAKWYPSGVVTNPAANQVLADTGPFTVDLYRGLCAYAASTAAGIVRFQLVAADGTTVRKEQYFPLTANGTTEFCPPTESGLGGVLTFIGERFRIIANSAITGSVSVSIIVPQDFD